MFSISPCLLWKEIGLDSGDMGKDRIQGEHRAGSCNLASDWLDSHNPTLSLVRGGQSLPRRARGEGDNSQHKQQPGWQHRWQREEHHFRSLYLIWMLVCISLLYLEIYYNYHLLQIDWFSALHTLLSPVIGSWLPKLQIAVTGVNWMREMYSCDSL